MFDEYPTGIGEGYGLFDDLWPIIQIYVPVNIVQEKLSQLGRPLVRLFATM